MCVCGWVGAGGCFVRFVCGSAWFEALSDVRWGGWGGSVHARPKGRGLGRCHGMLKVRPSEPCHWELNGCGLDGAVAGAKRVYGATLA